MPEPATTTAARPAVSPSAHQRRAQRRRRRALRGTVFYTAIVLTFIPFLFVFYYMIATSLKAPLDISSPDYLWIFTPTMDNYRAVFEQTEFLRYMINSLIVGFGSVALGMLLGVPAAYAIARHRASKLGLLILSSRVTPGITFLVPWFLIFSRIDLTNTFLALILVHTVITLPLICWLMIGFFEEIPQELIDSALVDGATTLRALWSIILPVTKGGLASAAILAFIFSWNHFLFSIVIAGRDTRPLPVAVFEFMSYGQVNWGAIAAAATVMTLPVIVIAMFVQRHIVQGLAGGAVKG